MYLFTNWKCYNYNVDKINGDYSYQELKEYFAIDGSNRVKCIKDFGIYITGNIYRVTTTVKGFLIY